MKVYGVNRNGWEDNTTYNPLFIDRSEAVKFAQTIVTQENGKTDALNVGLKADSELNAELGDEDLLAKYKPSGDDSWDDGMNTISVIEYDVVDALADALSKFTKTLVDSQEDIDPEIAKIIHDRFMDLI